MTIDEHMAEIARNLDTLTKLHRDGGREWREAQAANEKAQAANAKRFEQIARTFADARDSI